MISYRFISNNIELNDSFMAFLMWKFVRIYTNLLRDKLRLISKIQWENIVDNLSYDAICDISIKTIQAYKCYYKTSHMYIINFDNKRMYNDKYSEESIFRLANWGSLNLNGLHLFEKAFTYLTDNLESYLDEYLLLGG